MAYKFNSLLSKFDYRLPPALIAQAPAQPRDSARLLVYNKRNKKIRFDTFANIGKYLPKNSVLVFNQTKVWPARLVMQKSTGGKAELLYIGHDKKHIKCLANRKLALGSTLAIVGPFFKTRSRGFGRLEFEVKNHDGRYYFLRPNFPAEKITDVLKAYGITPLPPYIKHSPLTEKQKRKEYQTVFAKAGLSVAAPTASLHFTKLLLAKLKQQGIDIKFVQLDVGLGTFAPLKEENLKKGKLHNEFYNINRKTSEFLNLSKQQGRPIIAVGTTVARTLESAVKNRQLKKLQGNTDLFIREKYNFQFIDGIITNFHVPKSSLIMLISAFVGRKKLLMLYKKAIKKRYRFFSFGDGMLILP